MDITIDIGNFILSLVAIVASAYFAFCIKRTFRPNVSLKLIPRWLDSSSGLLAVGISIGSQGARFVTIKSAKLQCLEHNISASNGISEFVPFNHQAYKDMYQNDQEVSKWCEPIAILTSTTKLEPEEKKYVERLIKCSPISIVQLGLQIKTKGKKDSWTTTCFVFPEPT